MSDMFELKRKLGVFRESLADRSVFCFTSDIDWAGEYAIEKTVEMFGGFGIRPTMFLTHDSPAANAFIRSGAVDAGIHPNFLPGSSQGGSFGEVIDFCMKLLPGARCYRSHRYFEVNDIMESLAKRGIAYTSNVCTMLEDARPFVNRSAMVSFPIFMEDGAYLLNGCPLDFGAAKKYFEGPGLKVINLHPMHLMLNTPHFKYTRDIKDRLSRREWLNLDDAAIAKLGNAGRGIADFAKALCEYAAGNCETKSLGELYDEILSVRP